MCHGLSCGNTGSGLRDAARYPPAACCRLKGRARRKLLRPLLFGGSGMRVYVYVDGFNLYYRALRGTPYKWLDIRALAQSLLDADDEIVAIRYFTARVRPRPDDPDAPRRQQLYISALRTTPNLTIHYGRFLPKTKWRPLVNPPPGGPRYVEIHDTEEKGSDVNLASFLLHDGWHGRYDAAFVLSQDTDLCEPVRMVRDGLNKPVGIACMDGNEAGKLGRVSSFSRHVRPAHLEAAQFPNPIMGRDGHLIEMPEAWLPIGVKR